MKKFKPQAISLALVLALIVGVFVIQSSKNTVNNFPYLEYGGEPVPDFNQYERVQDKKRAFFNYLTPVIVAQNEYISSVRTLIRELQTLHLADQSLTTRQQKELDWLITEYRVKDIKAPEEVFTKLLRRVDVIPAELVLVQTANESAWGTSRFAQEGYNFFGIWCFDKGCGFVPTKRNEGAAHEVAKFDDLNEAMYAYMRNLNSHPAYTELRAIRSALKKSDKKVTANALAAGLINYSERREAYIEEIRMMIRVNQKFMSSQES